MDILFSFITHGFILYFMLFSWPCGHFTGFHILFLKNARIPVIMYISYLLLYKNYFPCQWLQIRYIYCLIVFVGLEFRQGLAECGSGPHTRLQPRGQLGLRSSLNSPKEGFIFNFTEEAVDSLQVLSCCLMKISVLCPAYL